MTSIFSILLILHIAAGFSALVVGLVPMLTRKGSKRHRQGGIGYVIAMTLVFLTAISMSLMTQNWFLFSVGLFSYYLTFTGWRLVKRTKLGVPLDFGISLAMWLVSLGMIGAGIWLGNGPGVVLIVFGGIGLGFASRDVWQELRRWGQPFDFAARSRQHISRMGGSYISAFTAFAVTNIHFLPSMLTWLLPTVVGTGLIVWATRRWRRRLG